MCTIRYDFYEWGELGTQCPYCGDTEKVNKRRFVVFRDDDLFETHPEIFKEEGYSTLYLASFSGRDGIECPNCKKILCPDCGDWLDLEAMKKDGYKKIGSKLLSAEIEKRWEAEEKELELL